MNNKITLIIPDIHLKHKAAEKIIESVKPDCTIFLGDYFDEFGCTPVQIEETAMWLANSLSDPTRIHLRGNHDVHYEFPYRIIRSSGYTDWKYRIINDIMPPQAWMKLKWYHFLDEKWLLTHAGLHVHHVPIDIRKKVDNRQQFISELSNYLDDQIIDGIRSAATNVNHWTLNAGAARGGSQTFGGIVWCDFDQEFKPFNGINQMMGHTAQNFGKWARLVNNRRVQTIAYGKFEPEWDKLNNPDYTVNVCLDVYQDLHYAVWDGNRLLIHKYNYL